MDEAMIPEKVSSTFNIPCYMFDLRAQLRPAAFMDLAQEIAAEGVEVLHFADHDLKQFGMVWIIARMQVRFLRYPKRLDSATIETWHRGQEGLFFIRDYRLLDTKGEVMVVSTSSWILMDTAHRSIVRPDRLPDAIRKEAQCHDQATDGTAGKIILPKTIKVEDAGERICQYSDLDYNGHVNNARYVVWTLDAIPQDWTLHRDVREFSINFNKEVRPGEHVLLQCAQDGDSWYVEGRDSDGIQNFICKVEFD